MVAVASAAFFLVGIVAFRSVVAAPFAAAVLLEVFAAFAGLAAVLVGGALVLTRALAVAFVATLSRAARVAALGALAFSALSLLGVAAARGLAAMRAFVVAGLFAAGRLVAAFLVSVTLAGALVDALDRAVGAAERVALARLTEAAGGVDVRAAALDATAGLAVRPVVADLAVLETLPVGFWVVRTTETFAVAAFAALAEAGLVTADFVTADFVTADFVAAGFVATGLRAAGLAAAVPADLRSRAAGLVLGDISATPEIGRSPSCVIDDDMPRGRQGT